MIHFVNAVTVNPAREITPLDDWSVSARHRLLAVRDSTGQRDEFLEAVCDFLGIGIEYANGADDIGMLLTRLRPMAVVARLEGEHQDGFHVMKVVSSYDRTLPVLLLHGNETSLLGAVDAVREIWDLRRVTTAHEAAGVAPLAEFIFDTARGAAMPGLMRV